MKSHTPSRSPMMFGILAVILLLGAGLRFWHMADKGLFEYDEGDFMLRIKTYATLPGALRSVLSDTPSDITAWSRDAFPAGFFPGTSAFPTALVPAMLVAMVIGDYDWLIHARSALAGVLAVWVVWLAVRHATGRQTPALIAAALVAFSPWHMLYSRVGLTHATAGLFLAVAALCIAAGLRASAHLRYRYIFGAGVALGFTVSSHYGTLAGVGAFGLYCIGTWMLWHRNEWLSRTLVLGAGLLTPLLFWQLVIGLRSVALSTVGYGGEKGGGYGWELWRMVRDIFASAAYFPRGAEPTFFLDMFKHEHGIITLVLWAGGLVLLVRALRRRSEGEGLLLFMAFLPIALYAVFRFQVTRTYVPYLPFTLIAVALALEWVCMRIARGHRRVGVGLAALAALVLIGTWAGPLRDVVLLQSPYREAAHKVQTLLAEGRTVVVNPWAIYQYYVGERLPNFSVEVPRDASVVYVADYASLNNPVEDALQREHVPFLEMPNPLGSNYALLRDNLHRFGPEELRARMAEDPRMHTVRFYDLGDAYTYRSPVSP